jgi:metal-sulfur cluster biosynthetic enzyme
MPSLFQRLRALWKKPESVTPLPGSTPQSEPTGQVGAPAFHNHQLEHEFGHAQFVNEALVYTVLRTCHDPEIPLNIVDLGLIYSVEISDEKVNVKMTLTTQGCGMGGYISREAEERIRSLPGVKEANVEIVWDPPWTPEMISLEGRKILGLPD